MQNLKTANKKIIIMSIITLVITIGLGIFFMVSLNADFVATKTIWGRMTAGVSGDTPGSGELVLIASLISGLTFLGELTAIVIIIFAYFLIPFAANALIMVFNLIARLFQIGKNKEWKDVTTKALLIFAIVLQGILNLYILFLCFTGYGLAYIAVYLMLIINVFAFVKNIVNLRKSNNQINVVNYN
jgi:hypothetical protein